MPSDAEKDVASPSASPDDSADQDNGDMTEMQDAGGMACPASKDGSVQRKTAVNAKDPLRPRRKKARRACFACQRAHLTCGDERPCQRCIKRGLSEQCADGVRKKAKYLHDAPNEALLPGQPGHYHYINNLGLVQQRTPQSTAFAIPPSPDLYGQSGGQASAFPIYGTSISSGQLPDALIGAQTYGAQQSPITLQFPTTVAQPSSSMQSLVGVMRQAPPADGTNTVRDAFGTGLFDPQDPSQYAFDTASFNFGNHYGALEFGMLGHMATGAAESPSSDSTGQLNHNNYTTPATLSANYPDATMTVQPYLFGQDAAMSDWPTQAQSNVRQSSSSGAFDLNEQSQDPTAGAPKQEMSSAFPIALASAFNSPSAELNVRTAQKIEDNLATNARFGGSKGIDNGPESGGRPPQANPFQQQTQRGVSKRSRDPSTIYDSVTQPYSYTTGFHSLIACIQKRFPPPKTLRIAKALASIRPSFISCTKTLGREDLVFMEKCFQRTLWEYEEFIAACGTPTIVCRRTGEVAAVGKEFSILTGWKKEVLLGKEANLNVNIGGGSGQAGTTASSRGGMNTPRMPEGTLDASHPKSVFLAELLDDDSVIEFYEDFARLAFGDSRGGVTTRCKLLRYQTKEDVGLSPDDGRLNGPKRRAAKGAAGEEVRIEQLGQADGKVDCSCCWTVKRDLFDLPMMIVMNFLPCI